jgi:hypothetical protein
MVCALGFLNRAGLDQLPHIFHDYQTWQDWGSSDYDPADNLMGFTLENLERVERLKAARATLKAGLTETIVEIDEFGLSVRLEKERKDFYEDMAKKTSDENYKGKKRMNLRAMATAYRDKLADVSPPSHPLGNHSYLAPG